MSWTLKSPHHSALNQKLGIPTHSLPGADFHQPCAVSSNFRAGLPHRPWVRPTRVGLDSLPLLKVEKNNPSNTSPPFHWPSSGCEFHFVGFWKTSMLRESPSGKSTVQPCVFVSSVSWWTWKKILENENVNPRHRQHEGVKNQCGIKSSRT